ncbi:MAG TPA: ATP-binding protein [Gemmatimonadaceae bacterium]|nr:ATP-binding protein [Gemmatimonadaceae bacterium]
MRQRASWSRAGTRLWVVTAGVALVAGAWWLRSPRIRYLAVAAAATGLAALVTLRGRPRRAYWAAGGVAALAMFVAIAAVAQRTLRRIDVDWPRYRDALVLHGESRLDDAFRTTARGLRATAAAALDAPLDPPGAFAAARQAMRHHPGEGLVIYLGGNPLAWAGRVVVPTDSLTAPIGVVYTPFYVTMYAAATRGETRAVATAVLQADPPGDRLVPAVANRIARVVDLSTFDARSRRPATGPGGGVAFSPHGDTLVVARAIAPGPEEARFAALGRVRETGTVVLALAAILFLVVAWRGERSVAWRLAPLGVALLAVWLLPLSGFSSGSVFFDPTVYYAELGGAFTASVGALILAAAIVLLALLVVLRGHGRIPPRGAALALVVAIMAGGPFLLRALSRGVSPPPGGVTTTLWLAWEIALFLVAGALLVAAATAGGAALGRARGLPPAVAPILAAGAALLGPVVLRPPGIWPQWYTVLWIVAIGALALTRPHRRAVITAATVAALGATTLAWNAGVRGQAALANRDVGGLGTVEPDVVAVLQRFGDMIADDAPPRSEAELVRLYMRSDLVGSGYPVALQSWNARGMLDAEVALDPIVLPRSDLARAVMDARASRARVVRQVLGTPGMFALLAVPFADGSAATVLVAPRTRLIPDDPYNALLGLEQREHGPPPYSISLADLEPGRVPPNTTRWYRTGSELHGDHVVLTSRGPRRAHIEIELRSLATLVQRGTLVVLLDLVLLLALWTVSALPDRAFGRWLRMRARRWTHSYRARLTVGLFAFFVVPALVFALWSYQRLRDEDRQSRDLVVRETLRTATGGEEPQPLDAVGERVGTPLLLFEGGELQRASDPLFDALVPTGRFVPPAVYQGLREGREVYASRLERVGDTLALFGYRSALAPGGETVVLAAPARGNEDVLDQRRRDLGVLVLFATVLGALGALWLSRVASRSLAQPIGSLRGAALAIAGGEREPPLARRPPEEFEPVFSAFRRMAADLGASRAALESAQRRTAAVLRNVASGVVALASDGAVTLANPRAESLLGAPLAAGPLMDAVCPAVAERLHAFLARGGDEEEFELVLAERQLQARLTRLTSGGAVLTLDDVTDLARAQRVLAWGEMARQVAHEIKNPLTPIRLGVQHLQRAHGDKRPDFDEILDRNARRILAEIDRLDEIARSFSRYGTAPPAPAESVDVAAVARDVVELERLGRGAVDWRLTVPDGPVLAVARGEELHEVLLNVLENARLAEARRVELRVLPADGRVRVEVIDDGRGIPAAVLPRLFEPHFSTRTSGSGLGLAISRRLVESWGGEIAIASVEGEGTVVRIELRGGLGPGR